MADVRDILGVPRGAGASAEKGDAPAKPKEQKMQRPAGMSREAFALLGGSHPIVPSVLTEELRKKEDLKGLKQKRKSSAKGQVCHLPIGTTECEHAPHLDTMLPRPCMHVPACKGGMCNGSKSGMLGQTERDPVRVCACRSRGGGRALRTPRGAMACSCSTG